MTVYKSLDPIHARLERKALYDASLKLVKDGKFQAMGVNEIAFVARISEGTLPYIFESRDKLVADLIVYVTRQINSTIVESLRKPSGIRESFDELWNGLFEFYQNNPNIIAFVEQFESISRSREITHPGLDPALVSFIAKSQSRGVLKSIQPETIAYMFHENVVTAAKMKSSKLFSDVNFDATQMRSLLWNALESPNA